MGGRVKERIETICYDNSSIHLIADSEFVKNPYYETSGVFCFDPRNALMLDEANVTRVAFTTISPDISQKRVI